ncbi:MAG: 8-oxoguanine DNA glycosylase, N-terminal domain-containing protein, partial [Lachnospiraceae bacterium]|nr:8-oxoguanine DNA glycosylase, N-terminal domain-containing protein [Lachnospiraceae bacterium]
MIVTINNLDLAQIADSGQCFRWHWLDEASFEVIAYDRYLKLRQNGNEFDLSCDEEQWNEIWSTYLDTDTDYAGIGRRIRETDDEYLKEAYEHGQGIRILRQELWETLISFIISQNNNIKRIRG